MCKLYKFGEKAFESDWKLFDPPVNSGGALAPPHFIDINRGGTDPPCKATSIEWRSPGFF